MAGTVVERPLVAFGPEVCTDLDAGLRREWLVTNGLGGYASGTLAGINTRRYHGLLVAALEPPVGRTVLVAGSVDWATYAGHRYALSTHEFADGTVHPRGYQQMQSFALEGALPVWTFALADARLERRVWMAYGANTTYVTYRLLQGGGPVELEVIPLLTHRDFHALTSARNHQPSVEAGPAGVSAADPSASFQVLADGGRFAPGGDWYWNFRHREETARGFDDRSDLYTPGTFTTALRVDGAFTLTLTVEPDPELNAGRALEAERARQRALLLRAGAEEAERPIQQLVLAADQFIVRRRPAGKTMIAGYHWFNDWGRDTMIALPGLCLATGRHDDARDILTAFAPLVVDGLLPNNFPDRQGEDPGYNTVDAALWYVLAIDAYLRATGERTLGDRLLSVIRRIIDAYAQGTRYGIGVDPRDGLLRAGAPGVQLTWMDAKVGDWVVTPRIGKPVEINALWHSALRILAALLGIRGDPAAAGYEAMADRVRSSFRQRFLQPGARALADVVDGPGGDDLAVRPNQIFAVSLPFPLLDGADAAAVVDAAGRALLTTYGLRSLSADDAGYQGRYGGGSAQRDGAYHRGTVWPWLMGAYVDAWTRLHGDLAGASKLLRPFEHHLTDAGLGTLSEIFEGDAPHLPRGCIAQAWSVAEILRVWRRQALII